MPEASAEFSGAEFTGERVVPGHVDEDLFNEHLSRYAFARRHVGGRRVLDVGCGTGYGAALLAEAAGHVTATDLSPDAVQYARDRYNAGADARPNLFFAVADAAATVPGGPFDVITAFEVIEHLANWRGMLAAARSQLSDDGVFLVSTPNKPLYTESRGEHGENPFHLHEFEFAEFHDALASVFPCVRMLVQNHSSGILFSPAQGSGEAHVSIPEAAPGVEEANFFLAVCSLQPLPNFAHFFWIPKTANLLRERDRHIAALRGEVALKTQWMEQGRIELLARHQEFSQLLQARQQLQEELEARNRWAAEQDRQLQERGRRIEDLQREVESAHAEFGLAAAAYEERMAGLEEANRATAAWAHETERRLGSELAERGQQLAHVVALLDQAEKTVEERTVWAQGLDRELREWQARFTALRTQFWVRAASRLHLITEAR